MLKYRRALTSNSEIYCLGLILHLYPDQAIPAGLHVRMDLQTGEKEAKLMDEDDTPNKQGIVS